MNVTLDHVLQLFMPLVIALHEKKVIDIAEVPHFYEDAIERQKQNLQTKEEDLVFLRQVVRGMTGLAQRVKEQERNRPL